MLVLLSQVSYVVFSDQGNPFYAFPWQRVLELVILVRLNNVAENTVAC